MRNGWTRTGQSRIDHAMTVNSDSRIQPSRPGASPSLASLGGWRSLFANPGTILYTLRRGGTVGRDSEGNSYFEERRATLALGRKRRWVIYAGRGRDASVVPPEWHAWLHFTTDAPLTEQPHRSWEKPHLPSLTGSPLAYRPSGHDYSGGTRVRASADYEAWTPEA